ncbi:hypothetical protein K438DRAFT_2154682 [Mycena galopus ATCC 62051]|nr:hypothetical protein K438DRAFT_2154682 [Mycena galopus ATCC 62051]
MNDTQLFCGGHQYVQPDGGYNSDGWILIDQPRWGYLLARRGAFKNPKCSHPHDVIGRIWLTVETRAKILPDRSYSSLGFLAHRENSIVHREFNFSMNSENPEQTLKTIDQTSRGLTVGVNAGYASTVAATATYTRGAAKTVELADNKPIPKCYVIPDPGERWNKNGKSYISYDITTVPKEDPRSGIRHPLHAQFAMGINIHCPKANPKLPKISFITRNQVIVWISDAIMKSKTFIPNIRTPEELFVQEQLDVRFGTDITVENTAPHRPSTVEEAMPLSLSLAAIESTKSRQSRITELFTDVRNKVTAKKRPKLADLPLREYISRGWDPDNGTWRDVVWTSLDKDFRITELEKAQTTPVWKLGWKPCKQEDDSDLDEKEVPVDAVATENHHGGPGAIVNGPYWPPFVRNIYHTCRRHLATTCGPSAGVVADFSAGLIRPS